MTRRIEGVMRRTAITTSVALLFSTAARLAIAADDCSTNIDGQRRIDACTEAINNSRLPQETRATAYFLRGLAYEQNLRNYEAALNDFSKAAERSPAGRFGVLAICSRASVNAVLKQYDEAISDADTCLGMIDSKRNDLGVDIKKLRDGVDGARKSAQRGGLEQRWVEYLQDIQRTGDYLNWSDCPYDLYVKAQRQDPGTQTEDTLVDKVACLPSPANGWQLFRNAPQLQLLVTAVLIVVLSLLAYWVRQRRMASSSHPTFLDQRENVSVDAYQRARGPSVLAIFLAVLSVAFM